MSKGPASQWVVVDGVGLSAIEIYGPFDSPNDAFAFGFKTLGSLWWFVTRCNHPQEKAT